MSGDRSGGPLAWRASAAIGRHVTARCERKPVARRACVGSGAATVGMGCSATRITRRGRRPRCRAPTLRSPRPDSGSSGRVGPRGCGPSRVSRYTWLFGHLPALGQLVGCQQPRGAAGRRRAGLGGVDALRAGYRRHRLSGRVPARCLRGARRRSRVHGRQRVPRVCAARHRNKRAIGHLGVCEVLEIPPAASWELHAGTDGDRGRGADSHAAPTTDRGPGRPHAPAPRRPRGRAADLATSARRTRPRETRHPRGARRLRARRCRHVRWSPRLRRRRGTRGRAPASRRLATRAAICGIARADPGRRALGGQYPMGMSPHGSAT